MKYLKEVTQKYRSHQVEMIVRIFGIYAVMRYDGGTIDHCFSWEEIEQCRFNPILKWADTYWPDQETKG